MGVSKQPNVNEPMCPSRLVLEHVTSRWGVLVLAALLERSYRFSELRREIGGVSEKMLAQTLQTLERDGFVHRDAKPVIPPRVDYSLTPSAKAPPARSGSSPAGRSSRSARSRRPVSGMTTRVARVPPLRSNDVVVKVSWVDRPYDLLTDRGNP